MDQWSKPKALDRRTFRCIVGQGCFGWTGGKTQIFFILFYQVGGLSDSEAGTAAAAFTLGGLVGTIAGGFAVRCTSDLIRDLCLGSQHYLTEGLGGAG